MSEQPRRAITTPREARIDSRMKIPQVNLIPPDLRLLGGREAPRSPPPQGGERKRTAKRVAHTMVFA